jgi:SAM-dependent methyltransferase
MELIKSEMSIELSSINSKEQSRLIDLKRLLKKKILVYPDQKDKLITKLKIEEKLNFHGDSPILFPPKIFNKLNIKGDLKIDYYKSSLLQYYLLSQIKGKSEINSPSDSKASQKHFYRMKTFCEKIKGDLMLDIGCDNPKNSHLIYPRSFEYIGIDPSYSNNIFKIIGMAEILPFIDLSFDFISFNTSLDHVLDFNSALDESFRVLKHNGIIVIATYAWLKNATLLTDNVHFHHFREEEILPAISRNFKIIDIKRYEDPKNQSHRYGLYIKAKK